MKINSWANEVSTENVAQLVAESSYGAFLKVTNSELEIQHISSDDSYFVVYAEVDHKKDLSSYWARIELCRNLEGFWQVDDIDLFDELK